MLTEAQGRLLDAHNDIDDLVRRSPLPFVSGWETQHNVRYEFLQTPAETLFHGGAHEYRFMSDDELLKEKIRRFHERVDGQFPGSCDVFLGAGSSALLSSLMIMLSLTDETNILYAKPIFHAYYFMAKVLGLTLTAVGETTSAAREQSIAANLPNRRSVLIVTDPSWISGRFLTETFWGELRRWQDRTESLIVVDGTFQYTKWYCMDAECSSVLDPERTFRLVCPTKSLCIHGIRFAYFIVPNAFLDSFSYAYCKLVGSASVFDLGIAHRMMDQLSSPRNNRDLVDFVRGKYTGLIERGLIKECLIRPQCTYYVFGRLALDPSALIAMDGSYFELEDAEDFIRINILSPGLAAISDAVPTPLLDRIRT